MFVRNFLSFQTPYNSLLIYHGLGTGKTCSSITIAEEMRDYLKQVNIKKKIIVVASPVVQENYKIQLFDERKLKNIGGIWDLKSCVGNSLLREINPINSSVSRINVISKIRKIIRNWYIFMGYTEFSNYITKLSNKFKINDEESKVERRRKQLLIKKEFSERLIIIDEVQNIRSIKKMKKSSNNFLELVKYADNLKLILLTATPMYNDPQEIIWLLNLMNINDNRVPISIRDVFNDEGNLLVGNNGEQIGKEILERKMRGYISYVRGENPFTFPNAIYPADYDDPNSLKYMLTTDWTYPSFQINDTEITQPIKHLDLFVTDIGSVQNDMYLFLIDKLKKKFPILKQKRVGIQYTITDSPLQLLNFAYPHPDFNTENADSIDIKDLYGKSGLSRIMNYNERNKRNFEYKPETLSKFGRIFSKEKIGKYSGKISKMLEIIEKSKGIVILYSQFIDGGCVPLALALEEMGMKRYTSQLTLFKKNPNEEIDAVTMKKKADFIRENPKKIFYPAKYAMITGDSYLSPNNKKELKATTDAENINGEVIKVIIISKAGSEGLDFKNIRQIHILEPWYNLMRPSQVIGRGIRNLSHCSLPYKERNTQLFLYGTELNNTNMEPIDLYMYRLAEKKGIKIGAVSRIMKENAVDCLLNRPQTQLYKSLINKKVEQEISTGGTISYALGDEEYSLACDFMKCAYECKNAVTDEDIIDTTTYNERFLIINSEIIIKKIKKLFKEKYLYTKNELIKYINQEKEFPIEQINSALDYLINNPNDYLIDLVGRLGYLKNVNHYYLFQPYDLSEAAKLTNYKLKHPISLKPQKLTFRLNNKILDDIESDVLDKNIIANILNGKFKKIKSYSVSNDMIDFEKGRDIKKSREYLIGQSIYNVKTELLNDDGGDDGGDDDDDGGDDGGGDDDGDGDGDGGDDGDDDGDGGDDDIGSILFSFIVYHILDRLDYSSIIKVLDIMNNGRGVIENTNSIGGESKTHSNIFDNEFIPFINMFFDTHKIGENIYVFKNYKSKNNFSVVSVDSNNKIIPEKINTKINKMIYERYKLNKLDINNEFGFMGRHHNSFIFKIKNLDIKEKNNTGKICRGNKKELLRKLKSLYKKKYKKVIYEDETIKIKPEKICFEIELLLRYYDFISSESKRWFFSTIEEIFYDLKKYPKMNKQSVKFLN